MYTVNYYGSIEKCFGDKLQLFRELGYYITASIIDAISYSRACMAAKNKKYY